MSNDPAAPPRTPQQFALLTRGGTLEEFLAVYRPEDATDAELGPLLLLAAVGQHDPLLRPEIAGRLLDDGADPTVIATDGSTTLHVLVGQSRHDFEAEAPILRRLLEGGADLNRMVGRHETPLLTIAQQFRYGDAELAPFYDEFFARPDLDLRKENARGQSVLELIQKWVRFRAELLARAEAYLAEHE
ncbi:MAG: hypothetical protein QM572_07010 [Nocardioides sp.]|uniref:hypothetical protein n=1 Tax=Nocardioides sp. TaxID=35761 RepID=UPI0039E6AE43